MSKTRGKYRVGVIGFGSMGRGWSRALTDSARWELVSICDISAKARDLAKQKYLMAQVTDNPELLLQDSSLDVVGIFTLADQRPPLIERALQTGKHLLLEKPVAADLATEDRILALIESSDRQVAVDLFNRNAWYHHEARGFIESGEIGDLAIVRVRHESPGLLPYARNPSEAVCADGVPFHDCGMHYVDVARWYAKGEYVAGKWHAQGQGFWGVPHPWWIEAHGAFSNGVVFSVTQGHNLGHLAKDKASNCGLEAIGTLGFVRYSHDFKTVNLQCHGITRTVHKEGPYGGKKLDVMVKVFADSLDAGRNVGYPTARDAVIASRVSAEMSEQAYRSLPNKGSLADLQRIFDHHKELGKEQKYAPGFTLENAAKK